jgi:hypothetical protein
MIDGSGWCPAQSATGVRFLRRFCVGPLARGEFSYLFKCLAFIMGRLWFIYRFKGTHSSNAQTMFTIPDWLMYLRTRLPMRHEKYFSHRNIPSGHISFNWRSMKTVPTPSGVSSLNAPGHMPLNSSKYDLEIVMSYKPCQNM